MSSYDTSTIYTSPEYRRACALGHRYEDWLSYQTGPDSILDTEQSLLDTALHTLSNICHAYHATCTRRTRAQQRAKYVDLAIWCRRFERHIHARRARTFERFADYAGVQVYEIEEAWAMDTETTQALIKRISTRRYAAEEVTRRRQEQRWRRGETSRRPAHVYLQPSREVLVEEAIDSLDYEETVLIEESFEILSTPTSPPQSSISTSIDSSSSTPSNPSTTTSPLSAPYDTDAEKPASS